MSVHLWASSDVTICGLTDPPTRNEGHYQCQDCFHLSAGHEYHGTDSRLKVASALTPIANPVYDEPMVWDEIHVWPDVDKAAESLRTLHPPR